MKLEEAGELYTKAGNLYKMSKQADRAGQSFMLAADSYSRAGGKADAAGALLNAANAYRKTTPGQAVNCLHQAIALYVSEGRFSIAAKHQKDIAEIYEGELDLESAISAYQQAADFYEGENSQSSANGCLLKVAQFSAQLEKYDVAIGIYEKISAASVDNNLIKWSVKEYLFRGALCHLATGDIVSAKRALQRYPEIDPSFSGTREFKFISDIIGVIEAFDTEAFTNLTIEFDNITKLDSWKTTMLLRIKTGIKDAGEGDLT